MSQRKERNIIRHTEERPVSVPSRHTLHGAISDYWIRVESHNVPLCGRRNDLWLLVGHTAVIAAVTIMLP